MGRIGVDAKSRKFAEDQKKRMRRQESKSLRYTKYALEFAVGIGVSAIVHGVVESSTVPGKLPMRICVRLARYGIASYVTNRVVRHLNHNLDHAYDSVMDGYQSSNWSQNDRPYVVPDIEDEQTS